MDRLLYEKLSNERAPQFNIVTDIVDRDGTKLVIKRPYSKEANDHIHRVFGAYQGLCQTLQGSAFKVNDSRLVGDTIESQFLTGKHIDRSQSESFVKAIKDAYMSHASFFTLTQGFAEVFGQVDLPKNTLAAPFVDIDLIFDNIIDTEDGWQIIDYEWTFDFPIPINYIYYRAIKYSDLDGSLVEISDAERACYDAMEEHFQRDYCFKGVKNLHEIKTRMDKNARTSADFALASKDYQIRQLQELIEAKDTHIRNIEAVNNELCTIYDNTVNTKGYQMLESIRALKDTLRGKDTPARSQRKAKKAAIKAQREAKKQALKAKKASQESTRVAVHLHLYYQDLLEEFLEYFSNISWPFDLYISCREDADTAAIYAKTKALAMARKVEVKALQNRGRDLAPLYAQFGEEISKHDYFLHVHTKKSLYSGAEKQGWRGYSLRTLLGSKERVDYIFSLFEKENAGLIYPDRQAEVPAIAYGWLKNEGLARELFKEYDLGDMPSVFNYPAGSFFWARTQALKPLFDRHYSYEDFPEEAGQTDGTLAHALERILPFVSRKQGYDDFILDEAGEDFSKNRSLKAFKDLTDLDVESLSMKLSSHRVVSFDIFDTLITRACQRPEDIYDLVGQEAKASLGLEVDFSRIRLEAEAAATREHGAFCNIDHIYRAMEDMPEIGDAAERLKAMELSWELRLALPRADMIQVFENVKAAGCRTILVSDMYLKETDIVALLRKCGISGYDQLFVSCQVGARKDDGSLWEILLANMAPADFIHVGDSFTSDSQVLMDKGFNSQAILNGSAMLELSDFSQLSAKKGKPCDSLALGLALNKGLLNSPFAYALGQLKFKDIYFFGYTCLGPLMASFVEWLVGKQAASKERLLLLSREGYMLEKMIKVYCQAAGIKAPEAYYFLTSRRAVAVAALDNEEDLRELVCQKYQGTFSNLLKERLGVEKKSGEPDYDIDYDTSSDDLMAWIEPYRQEIFARALAEKAAYLTYAKEFLDTSDQVAVVDVGFSGTIQYFLMKLTGQDIGGHYLCLHSNKPERIGGRADAIYEIRDRAKIGDSKLLRYQLFLENALSAPYGQLICFSLEDGKPVAQYKDDNSLSPQVVRLQQGILDFVSDFARAKKGLDLEPADPGLVEDIFYDIIFGGTLTEEIASSLTVEDGYSRGGIQRFDVVNNVWKVE